MIPTIHFQTSYYLQSKVIRVPYDREKLSLFLEKLRSFFSKHEKYLVNAIEQESGVAWPVETINVWLFHGWQSSISNPLLLNTYDEDLEFCFFNLVHELIHQNIMNIPIKNKQGDWDHVELEAIVNVILIRVLKKIFSKEKIDELSYFAEFRGLYKYVWIRTREIQKTITNRNISFSEWLGEHHG